MVDNRRSQARRGVNNWGPGMPGAQLPPPSTALGPSTAPAEYTSDFNVKLNGEGTISLLSYTCHTNEYARIEFLCLVSGFLSIRVGPKTVLRSKTFGGRALVEGLFFPAGSQVAVEFTNNWSGGAVSGRIHIGPAPKTTTVNAAMAAFGLAHGFTIEDLQRAYKRLTLRHHPDRPGGSNAKMAEVNHYYEALKTQLDG
jgi:hypothetical protein